MPLNWGIITAGGIANAFAHGLCQSRTGRLVATGASDIERAAGFAEKWGGRGYEGYAAVLDDPEVQAVYIATPHHLHAEWTIKAAKAGKAILCEKPFTLNHREARTALEAVESGGVFFMEAFMYRCSRQTRKLVELVQDGAIGKVRSLSAEFSYNTPLDRVNFRTDPKVGGGGLMDVGTYCTSLAVMFSDGSECVRAEYSADLSRGYDSHGVGLLEFENGLRANLASGVHLAMKNDATVYGESGWIHLEDPWKSAPGTKMVLHRENRDPEAFRLGCDGSELYALEADAVSDHLPMRECPFMTPRETLLNMQVLDRLRASCGLRFEAELGKLADC